MFWFGPHSSVRLRLKLKSAKRKLQADALSDGLPSRGALAEVTLHKTSVGHEKVVTMKGIHTCMHMLPGAVAALCDAPPPCPTVASGLPGALSMVGCMGPLL